MSNSWPPPSHPDCRRCAVRESTRLRGVRCCSSKRARMSDAERQALVDKQRAARQAAKLAKPRRLAFGESRRGGRRELVSGACQKCGVDRPTLHREHRVPRWMGGADAPENIQWYCANCHEDKSREEMRTPEWLDYLSRRAAARGGSVGIS